MSKKRRNPEPAMPTAPGVDLKDTPDSGVQPSDSPPDGLACPACGCRHLPVLFTRPHPGGKIRRVRECRHCGRRVISYESLPDR